MVLFLPRISLGPEAVIVIAAASSFLWHGCREQRVELDQ
jgi:hypothetical protein